MRGKFNRERLVLAAMQNVNQLYFMMDTQFEGIYQADAAERKREYGENVIKFSSTRADTSSLTCSLKELHDLLGEMARQKSAVFRKGMDLYSEIDSRDVVPGDMLFLTSGDIVPADVRIIYEREFYVDQKLFSGSAESVRKDHSLNGYTCSMFSIVDIPDICLMGCRVTGGVAKAVAIGTGSATYLGKLIYGY